MMSSGMTLPHSSSYPAESEEKREECGRVGEVIKRLLDLDIRPKDIVTRKVHTSFISLMYWTQPHSIVWESDLLFLSDPYQRLSNALLPITTITRF